MIYAVVVLYETGHVGGDEGYESESMRYHFVGEDRGVFLYFDLIDSERINGGNHHSAQRVGQSVVAHPQLQF